MADLAGIAFCPSFGLEYITFSVFGYNDGIRNFLKEAFKYLQNYEVDETFFNDTKAAKLRNLINSFKHEPYQRVD